MFEQCSGSGKPAPKPTAHDLRSGRYFTAVCPACGRTVEPKPPAFATPDHVRLRAPLSPPR